MTDPVQLFLKDIVSYGSAAIRFVDGMSEAEFRLDERTQFAVVRALEVVGEAVKCVPQSTRREMPDVPWRSIAAMRDKLIHHYFGVDLSVVWTSATEDLPELVATVSRYLDGLSDP